MKAGISTLERAFQLVESGQIAGIEELRIALRNESYDGKQIFGPTLLKQLRAAIRKAREGADAARP
jgi:hypothetical protein